MVWGPIFNTPFVFSVRVMVINVLNVELQSEKFHPPKGNVSMSDEK